MRSFMLLTVLCNFYGLTFVAAFVFYETGDNEGTDDSDTSTYQQIALSNNSIDHDIEFKDYQHDSVRRLRSLSTDNEQINFPVKLNRTARSTETCQLPQKRRDSTMMCVSYPKYVQCKQMCIFGHTLSDGVQRDYKCLHEENTWVPDIEMEKCLPFIDCTVRIVGSGRFKCSQSVQGNGPVCRIACNHYEDKPPVPESSYSCDISGKWSPELPHCVRPGSGKALVPPPKGIKYLR